MSQITVEPTTNPSSIVLRIFVIGVALGVPALQFAMAFRACVRESADYTELRQQSRFISGTVYRDELILLIATSRADGSSLDEVRCDLRTRRISTSDTNTGFYHLVSDGHALWRIPCDRGEEKSVWNPFAWSGRPVELPKVHRNRRTNLLEFTDGRWKESDEYILSPGDSQSLNTTTSSQDGRTVLQAIGYDEKSLIIEYCADVLVGPEERVIEFIDRNIVLRQFSRDALFREAGWQRAIINPTKYPLRKRRGLEAVANGFWFERAQPCLIQWEYQDDRIAGFFVHRVSSDQTIETQYVRSPIRWGLRGTKISPDGILKVITSNQGDVLIVAVDDSDGRVHILQWKDGQLRLFAQRRSPLVEQECRIVGRIVRDAVLAPTVLLGLLLWFVERIRGARTFSYAHQTAVLSSGVRRGIARMIDLSLPIVAFVASVVLHPDVSGWWFELRRQWRWSVIPIGRIVVDFGRFCAALVSVPTITWLFLVGIIIWLVQIISQGRTGYTPGKWLMGIRVTGTTLRPCGVARSLLREILLAVDSLMLLSWVPGFASILITQSSQRIGDILSDTIVVRDRPFDVTNKDELPGSRTDRSA